VLRRTEKPSYDHIHSEVPSLNPLIHMGTLYATVLGGVPASSFTGSPAIHAFDRRPSSRPLPNAGYYDAARASEAFTQDAAFRDDVESEFAAFGVFYDEAVVFGATPADFSVWRARGYVDDQALAATLIAHFDPCTIDVTLPASTTVPTPRFDVFVGTISVLEDQHPRPVIDGEGVPHFALAPSACGVVGVRAEWRVAGGARAFCTNADASGVIVAKITRDSHAVVCETREPSLR
jgi:hypothetical protein